MFCPVVRSCLIPPAGALHGGCRPSAPAGPPPTIGHPPFSRSDDSMRIPPASPQQQRQQHGASHGRCAACERETTDARIVRPERYESDARNTKPQAAGRRNLPVPYLYLTLPLLRFFVFVFVLAALDRSLCAPTTAMASFDHQRSSQHTLLAHDDDDGDDDGGAGSRDGNGKEEQVIYVQKRRSRCSLFRSWFGSFALGVLTSSVLFAVFLLHERRAPLPRTYAFADTDPLPSIPMDTVVFEANPVFSERPTDDSDYAWNMLLPPGRGYVFVPDAEARGLAPGQQTPSGPIYSVAMYHQLHCLARLRKLHWVFKDGIVSGEDALARSFAGRDAAAHAQHCFDYLRQAILCNADMTLEWPKQAGPSSGAMVDGWGVPHTCKSQTAIDDYMAHFHFNQSISIDAAG
nr:oxidase ustya [Quercus suber]